MKKLIIIMLFMSSLIAKQSFEATIKIEVTNSSNTSIYSKEKDVILINNKINSEIKHKAILEQILTKISILEVEYKGEDLFLLNTINDKFGNKWTINTTVTSKDTSMSHFISKQNEKTINGWVNRDNKDIFGLRLFNF